jgi:hypothetical protein
MELGNLGTWELGNLATWQLGNLALWQLGNLAPWHLGKAKILYGPKEKVGFQVFVYFRFFMKPELVQQSLF